LVWLRIKLRNLFRFAIYGVILVLGLRSRVWQVNSVRFFFCPFLINLFFQFYPSTFSWLRIKLYNLFWFVFCSVIIVSQCMSWIWHVNSSLSKSIQYLIIKKNVILKFFMSQIMFLRIVRIIFEPTKLIKLYQIILHMI
jgi:hypothetical protein